MSVSSSTDVPCPDELPWDPFHIKAWESGKCCDASSREELKTAMRSRTCDLIGEELDRNRTIEIRIERSIHGPHSAGADRRLPFVDANSHAGERRLHAWDPCLNSSSDGDRTVEEIPEIIEKSLTALGGRTAHEKLKSRLATGTIVLSTPAGEIEGSIEILNAAPNKSRSLIKADLSALGAGPLVLDQRFDGHAGYVLDTLQGNREIMGNQLDNMRNGAFPHPFLNYKDRGTSVQLSGKEKIGEREAYLVIFDPASGSAVRQYIDAETYLPIKSIVKVDVPQLGRGIEQTTEFSDYREADGIKLPFRARSTSSVQNFTVTIAKVEHNVQVDEKLFAKPAAQ